MEEPAEYLSIGEVAKRAGVATSALRFYEEKGLIRSLRTEGNQRRFHRAMLRRIAVIRVAQNLGLSLDEISGALAALPDGRNPTKRDWQRLSTTWRRRLEQRIAELENIRDKLSGCIGCGCLSMRNCTLYNPADRAADLGAGARYLLGDKPSRRK